MKALRKCNQCGLEAHTQEDLVLFKKHRNYKHGHQNQCKMCQREDRLKKERNLTTEDYKQMLKEQNNKCYICGTEDPNTHHGFFHIDHNHKTGETRKLLCNGCNTGLGNFKDNPKILAEAILYLEKYGNYAYVDKKEV